MSQSVRSVDFWMLFGCCSLDVAIYPRSFACISCGLIFFLKYTIIIIYKSKYVSKNYIEWVILRLIYLFFLEYRLKYIFSLFKTLITKYSIAVLSAAGGIKVNRPDVDGGMVLLLYQCIFLQFLPLCVQ